MTLLFQQLRNSKKVIFKSHFSPDASPKMILYKYFFIKLMSLSLILLQLKFMNINLFCITDRYLYILSLP